MQKLTVSQVIITNRPELGKLGPRKELVCTALLVVASEHNNLFTFFSKRFNACFNSLLVPVLNVKPERSGLSHPKSVTIRVLERYFKLFARKQFSFFYFCHLLPS
jgi:hypothetical protein